MTPTNEQNQPTHPKKPLAYMNRKIARWTGAFGVRSKIVDGQVERILERQNASGGVTSRLRISAVGFNGKFHLIAFEHKKMWNLIEQIFDRQGYPADGWITISSIAFYDYLVDIASMDDETRRKFRDGGKYADSVYNLLMVLMGTPWFFEDLTIGSDGVPKWAIERVNLIDKIEIYGKTQDAERGKIKIKLSDFAANDLRARNTTPILLSTQNAIKRPAPGILYGYLSQILYKKPEFREDVYVLADRLQIGSEGNVVRDMRRAAEDLEGLPIAYKNGAAKILICRIEEESGRNFFYAKREVVERPKKIKPTSDLEKARAAEERRINDARVQRDEYIARFRALSDFERLPLEKQVADKLSQLSEKSLKFGPELHLESAIVEVMERYISAKNDQTVGRICRVACEPKPVPYLCQIERDLYAALARAIYRYGETKPKDDAK